MSSESGEVKLYDLRERKYPRKRGDAFRSLQVFECYVCGALSNEVVMGGWPGWGVRCICPNACECWHHELEDKIKALDKFLDNKMIELRLPVLEEIKDDYISENDSAEKMYYLADSDCPNKPGEVFRSKIPFCCSVCGALTNKIFVDEKKEPAPLCLQKVKDWHRRLEKEWKELTQQIEDTEKRLRALHQEKINNDLAGNPDPNLKRWITNVRGWKTGQSCSHYI